MEARLFVGSRELSVAVASIPDIAHAAQALGHRVHWDAPDRTLYLDSPLGQVRVRCRTPPSDAPLDWLMARKNLLRQLGSSGALVLEGPRSNGCDLDLRLGLRLGSALQPKVEVLVHRPPWQAARVGQTLAYHIQAATGLPPRVEIRPRLRLAPRVHVLFTIAELPSELLTRGMDGLWRGLMAYFAPQRTAGAAFHEVGWVSVDAGWLEPVVPGPVQSRPAQPPCESAPAEAAPALAPPQPQPLPLYVWQWQRPPRLWGIRQDKGAHFTQ